MRRTATAVLGIVFLASACAGPDDSASSASVTTGVAGVGPTFGSIQAVAQRATHSFRGRIDAIKAHAKDDGGNSDDPGGIPMVLYTVTVLKEHKGAEDGPVVTVAWQDAPGQAAEAAKPLEVGQQYEFLTERLTAADAPGLAAYAPMYVPVGGEAGVLRVEGDRAESADSDTRRLRPDDSEADSWNLDSVEHTLAG